MVSAVHKLKIFLKILHGSRFFLIVVYIPYAAIGLVSSFLQGLLKNSLGVVEVVFLHIDISQIKILLGNLGLILAIFDD